MDRFLQVRWVDWDHGGIREKANKWEAMAEKMRRDDDQAIIVGMPRGGQI